MRISPFCILFFVLIAQLLCTSPTSVSDGGGSEVEVIGYVSISGNEPAPFTQVKLIPNDYDPSFMAGIGDSMIDTSDDSGRYTFNSVPPGTYNVQAVQLKQRTRMLVTGIEVSGDTTIVPVGSLSEPGLVKFVLSGNDTDRGFITIPGTDITKKVDGLSNEIVLDSVPAGIIPEIRYTDLDKNVLLTKHDVLVKSSDTTILSNISWEYKRRIYLNTTASGADVASDVYNFPVLIRLTANNFDFSQARANGEDIRFNSLQDTPLPYEIEHWDAAASQASIWVKIDTVYGNDSTQSILMYWGNPDAEDYSNGALVFDTSVGFQGVWHLGDGQNDLIHDATYNGYDGSSPDTDRPIIGTGAIGNCRVFNGKNHFITMSNTAGSKIDFPQNGYYSLSAWVLLDTLDFRSRCIVSKGYEQYYLRSSSFSLESIPNTTPFWEFVEFNGEDKVWQVSNSPVTAKQWVHLVGVREGTRQFLYCNGALVDSTIDLWPNENVGRKTSNDLYIGRFVETIQIPLDQGLCNFQGSIDEVRIISGALSPDWIRLCFMNQKPEDKLVVFK